MARLLTVVIPTFNNTKGLQYLLGYFKDKNYQIIIIDNKPTEEKQKIVHKVHKVIKFIKYLPQKKNLGFAGAVNLGAKLVNSDWLLVLNDDIEFPTSLFELRGAGESQKAKVKSPFFAKASEGKQNYNSKVKSYQFNIIEELVKEAERKKLDAVTPVLRNPDGEVENYGYKILPIGKVKLFNEFSEFNELDGITAACLLIKTSVFRKLKGFDERFFAYLEDVDFFLRFKKIGYKMGVADVEVLHNHMTTAKTMGNFKARQDMINWWRLYFKHQEKFRFNFAFIVERMRNVSGYIKASLNNSKVKS